MALTDAQRAAILDTLIKHNHLLLYRIRDEQGVAPDKFRSGVWVDGSYLEAELKIEDKEAFESDYRKFEVSQVLEEARRVHNNDPQDP